MPSVFLFLERQRVQIIIFLISFIILLPGLYNPLQTDEAYTYLHFAAKGPVYIFGLYNVPNNHILHSLLVWFFSFFGKNIILLRITAFLSALGIIQVFYMLLKKLTANSLFSALSIFFLVFSSLFYTYSYEARGYSLSNFLILLALYSYIRFEETQAKKFLYFTGLFSSLAVATLPTSIWMLIGFWIAIIIKKDILISDKIKYTFFNGIIIVVFYVSAMIYILLNPSSFIVKRLSNDSMRPSFFQYYLFNILDPIKSFQVMIVFLFSTIGMMRFKYRNPVAFAILSLIVCSYFIKVGFLRNYSFLIPLLYLLAAVGLWYLLDLLKFKNIHKYAACILIVLLFLSQSFSAFKRNIWSVKIDYAKEMSQYANTYFASDDHYYLLIHSTQVEYFTDLTIRKKFEETKRIPLSSGVEKATLLLRNNPIFRKFLNLIPELRHRERTDFIDINDSADYYLIILNGPNLENRIMSAFHYYGYAENKILLSNWAIQHMNERYLLVRCHLSLRK
jgi:hypothetical protein